MVGGYGVPAIACAVSLYILVIDNMHCLLAQEGVSKLPI